MNRSIIYLAVFIMFIIGSCNNNDKQAINGADIYAIPDTILAWEINADSMILKRDINIPDSIITIQRIINGLNLKYPAVQIVFIKQSDDTVFIAVPDAEYLGEQMGDAGSSQWYADAVINLTSVAGIDFVSFQIDLHSHASSGVIGRNQYYKWRRQ